ncbi:hypothetical protein ACFS7Z_17115 [Pontibacter toksunensis]|uniref:Uncharacterized protein n=1 Tax=Pontibacter toksunensis TaxID=1332631 RepID=A0ABW6BYN5_9BACT
MEPKKSLDEAILRAYPSTGKITQPQEKLFSMERPDQASYMNNAHHAPLNESHINLMHSWMNLRNMDNELAETKNIDMDEKKES